jgi:hypothetical protein
VLHPRLLARQPAELSWDVVHTTPVSAESIQCKAVQELIDLVANASYVRSENTCLSNEATVIRMSDRIPRYSLCMPFDYIMYLCRSNVFSFYIRSCLCYAVFRILDVFKMSAVLNKHWYRNICPVDFTSPESYFPLLRVFRKHCLHLIN